LNNERNIDDKLYKNPIRFLILLLKLLKPKNVEYYVNGLHSLKQFVQLRGGRVMKFCFSLLRDQGAVKERLEAEWELVMAFILPTLSLTHFMSRICYAKSAVCIAVQCALLHIDRGPCTMFTLKRFLYCHDKNQLNVEHKSF
jgi:hypothetical protein